MNKKKNDEEEKREKVKNYLLEAKSNLQRLEEGKKIKRKLKFVIKDHIFLFTFIIILLITSTIIPLTLFLPSQNEEPINNPYSEKIFNTLDVIQTNFTDNNGDLVSTDYNYNNTSYLTILSSLTHSIMFFSDYINTTKVSEKNTKLIYLIKNNIFRDFVNESNNLSIFEQFLGLYALIQNYFALKNSQYAFELTSVLDLLHGLLNNFFDFQKKILLSNSTDTIFLIEQSTSLWVLASFVLLFDIYSVYTFNLRTIIQGLIDQIENKFFNSSTYTFYSQYNYTSDTKNGIINPLDLIFLALAISRINMIENYYFSTQLSSYLIYDEIVSDFTDSDLFIYNEKIAQGKVLIKNQAMFTFMSYLMRSKSTGNQSRTLIAEYFSHNNGFYLELGKELITAESCLYGVIALACPKWSSLEHEKEVDFQQADTTAMSTSLWLAMLTLVIIVVPIFFLRKKQIVFDNRIF